MFHQNFIQFPLPTSPYKVFSNPPFHLEGQIIRKLLNHSNPPEEIHLIGILAVGERWVGHQRNSKFSTLHSPWYKMKILHRFRRSDFDPQPKIDTAMVSFTKRKSPLIPVQQKPTYTKLISQAFGGGRRINQNLSPYFTQQELHSICHQLRLHPTSKPSNLNLHHWIKLFNAAPKI